MLCKLHLSKVLKVNHEIKSELHYLGLRTTIEFKDIGVVGTILEVTSVGKGNIVTLDINSSDWEKLSNHCQ